MSDQQLIEEIEALKADRNAIILAHNYQRDEVQDLADYTGDSLGLSIRASQTDADVIVFLTLWANGYDVNFPNKSLIEHRQIAIQFPAPASVTSLSWVDVGQALHPNRVFSLPKRTGYISKIAMPRFEYSSGQD